MSDLRANTVRGTLAEYLVATALGLDGTPRVDWDSCDLRLGSCRIEVKSSAYLQAWQQRGPSKATFGGFTARTWDPRTGFSSEKDYNADVYVFALMTALDHAEYDALNTDSWHFWVLPVAAIRARGARSMSLTTLRALGGEPLAYADLRNAVLHLAGDLDR